MNLHLIEWFISDFVYHSSPFTFSFVHASVVRMHICNAYSVKCLLLTSFRLYLKYVQVKYRVNKKGPLHTHTHARKILEGQIINNIGFENTTRT